MIFFLSPCQPGREAGDVLRALWTGSNWIWLVWALCSLLCPVFLLLWVYSRHLCFLGTQVETRRLHHAALEGVIRYAGKMRIIFIYEVELQGCRRTRASQLVPLEWDLGTVLPLSVTLECCFPCKLWGLNSSFSGVVFFTSLLWAHPHPCAKQWYRHLCLHDLCMLLTNKENSLTITTIVTVIIYS